MTLQELEFSDLYVATSPKDSWYKPTPDSLTVSPVPDSFEAEITDLRKFLTAQSKSLGEEFRIQWPQRNGQRLRVAQLTTAKGQTLFVCRRSRMISPTLKGLGVPAPFVKRLTSSELNNGLVIFMGSTGSGKTTTAAAFVIERLTHHGGVCWSVENPIELPLEGQHGKGWCYQTEVKTDEAIGPAIRKLLRASPNIIFIGELRDSNAVREAITAGVSGHIVVATFHAGSLVSGLQRLASMANDDKIAAALADALRAAVHLNLYIAEPGKLPPAVRGFTQEDSKGTGTPPRILSFEPLWMLPDQDKHLQSIVREGKFELLTSELQRQARNALNTNTATA